MSGERARKRAKERRKESGRPRKEDLHCAVVKVREGAAEQGKRKGEEAERGRA